MPFPCLWIQNESFMRGRRFACQTDFACLSRLQAISQETGPGQGCIHAFSLSQQQTQPPASPEITHRESATNQTRGRTYAHEIKATYEMVDLANVGYILMSGRYLGSEAPPASASPLSIISAPSRTIWPFTILDQLRTIRPPVPRTPRRCADRRHRTTR